MKGAPGFKQWPDPVNGRWKIDLLVWLQKQTGIQTFFETGTCQGVTPQNLQPHFKQLFTIELHEGLYNESKKRLGDYANVKQYLGSSRQMLEKILTEDVPVGPVLFWLDAHSSGPHTADDGNPLPDEIQTITRLCPGALIVVDDMMGLNQFLGQISRVRFGNPDYWHVEFRTGEILMHATGLYNIPAFED